MLQEEVYFPHSITHWLNQPPDIHWSLHFDVHEICLMYAALYRNEISLDNLSLCTSTFVSCTSTFSDVHQRTFRSVNILVCDVH